MRGVDCRDQRRKKLGTVLQQPQPVARDRLNTAKEQVADAAFHGLKPTKSRFPFRTLQGMEGPAATRGHQAERSWAVKAAWSEIRCQALPV
jgi:hypothetical protein